MILVPRTDVGGGARILFEHANRLHRRGHRVTVLSQYSRPDWFVLECEMVRVPVGMDLADGIPACDLVVCGYWDQIPTTQGAGIAPVVHLEQGDFHLFEDLHPDVEAAVAAAMSMADETVTINRSVVDLLASRYQVTARMVPNAVDPALFRPDGPAWSGLDGPYLLLIGWDGNDFKGISEAREAWAAISRQEPTLSLVWVSPRAPLRPMGTVVVAPAQEELAAIYRSAAVFLSASRYETFPLPPLEAMSSGTPVVTTDNVGVLEYAKDGENCAVVPVGDSTLMAARVLEVLRDARLSARLTRGGLQTAQQYRWDAIMDDLETSYASTAAMRGQRSCDLWRRRDPSIEPLDAAAAEKVDSVLGQSDMRRVVVPVVRPGVDGHPVVSWEVLAERDDGRPGEMRCFAPHGHPEPPTHLPYFAGIDALQGGQPSVALARFMRVYQSTDDSVLRATLGRWIGLALLEADRPQEALEVLSQGIDAFPDNSDYVYLAAHAALAAGLEVDLNRCLDLLHVVGESTRYVDWFAEPMRRLLERYPEAFRHRVRP